MGSGRCMIVLSTVQCTMLYVVIVMYIVSLFSLHLVQLVEYSQNTGRASNVNANTDERVDESRLRSGTVRRPEEVAEDDNIP